MADHYYGRQLRDAKIKPVIEIMQPNIGRLYGLIEYVAGLRKEGRDALIVSSGAIGLGAQRLRLAERPADLALKQACAAVGQSR